jgi:DDE superfamily endonuclease
MPSHYDTPRRAKVRGVFEFLSEKGLIGRKAGQFGKNDVFDFFGVERHAGQDILKNRFTGEEIFDDDIQQAADSCSDPDARTLNNDPRVHDTRGRKRLFTETDRAQIHHLRELQPYEANRLGWQGLAYSAGVTVEKQISTKTLKRGLYPIRGHIEQRKTALEPRVAKARVERARAEAAHGKWKDPAWCRKHVSIDEVHFGFEPEGKRYVLRTPAEAKEWWTVSQVEDKKKKKKRKRQREAEKSVGEEEGSQKLVHAIGIVGFEFQTDLLFYKMDNSNGKMEGDFYVEILKRLLPQVEEHFGSKDFILFQDGDSSHNCPQVKAWLAENGYTSYTTPHYSPDLNFIESCVLRWKSHVKNGFACDIKSLEERIISGWRILDLRRLGEDVDSMQFRWEQIIAADGQRIAF